MYRDFIYLDTDRIQSIISQLNEGLLTEIMSGKNTEMSAKVGFLSQLIPVSASINAKRVSDIKENKVLHDYSFNLALESLKEESLLLDVNEFNREEFPVPDSAFISVSGTMKMLDYNTIRHLAENEKKLIKCLRVRM